MFLTLHIKMKALEIDEIVAFNEQCAFAVRPDDTNFFQQVASRRFSVMRIIVERETDTQRKAYHCVDFTGASFLITELSLKEDTSQALGRRIARYADKYALMVDYFPVVVDIDTTGDATEEGVRTLPKQEQNYHTFVKAIVTSYFTGA